MIRVLIATAAFAAPTLAAAQSITPMEANIVTFGDRGAVRAALRNPYATARRFEIEAFDLEWNPVDDVQLTRSELSLAPGGRTSLLAIMPIGEASERSIYLCATSMPYRRASAGIKGQVCGRYTVTQRLL